MGSNITCTIYSTYRTGVTLYRTEKANNNNNNNNNNNDILVFGIQLKLI